VNNVGLTIMGVGIVALGTEAVCIVGTTGSATTGAAAYAVGGATTGTIGLLTGVTVSGLFAGAGATT
jgi:hypothetical protein